MILVVRWDVLHCDKLFLNYRFDRSVIQLIVACCICCCVGNTRFSRRFGMLQLSFSGGRFLFLERCYTRRMNSCVHFRFLGAARLFGII